MWHNDGVKRIWAFHSVAFLSAFLLFQVQSMLSKQLFKLLEKA